MLLGATNRPGDIDEAALRRLTYKVEIPLPDLEAREQQFKGNTSQTPMQPNINWKGLA